MIQLPLRKLGQAKKGILLSILLYFVLAVLKCWIGTMAHAQTVFADGLNNFSDMLLSFGFLVGIIISTKPADNNHPFGHSKAENIASLLAALFMVLVSLHIWRESIQSLWSHSEHKIDISAIILSLVSALLLFVVSRINFRLSKKTNSPALRANAYDNQVDAWISMGAFFGSIGNNWGCMWLDAVVSLLLGIFILHTAFVIGKPAIESLMDGFDSERLSKIKSKIKGMKGVIEVKEIRARTHGSYVFVEITIAVDENLTVRESHDLTDEMEARLKGFENIEHVHVHVEPYTKNR